MIRCDFLNKPIREAALDALRGIAALIVVFSHLAILWTYPYINRPYTDSPDLNNVYANSFAIFDVTPLRILIAGHQAVIVFFVLSGFALTCMLSNKKNYITYIIARIIRL